MIPLRNKSQFFFKKKPMLKLLTELNSRDANNIRHTKSFAVSKSDSEPKGIKYVSHGRLGSLSFIRT